MNKIRKTFNDVAQNFLIFNRWAKLSPVCEDCGKPFVDDGASLKGVTKHNIYHPSYAEGKELEFLQLCTSCIAKRRRIAAGIVSGEGYTAVAYRIPEEYFVLLPGSEKVRSLWLREAITMELEGVKPYRSVASAMNRIEWSMLSRHLRKTDRRKRNDRTVVFRLKSSDVVRVKEDPILCEEELVIKAIHGLLKYEQNTIVEANDTKALKIDLPYLINVDEALRIVQGKR